MRRFMSGRQIMDYYCPNLRRERMTPEERRKEDMEKIMSRFRKAIDQRIRRHRRTP